MSIFQTLGKSCMSHKECQSFLDIYVENPEVCQMLIHLDKEGKLLSKVSFPFIHKEFYIIIMYHSTS